MADVVAYGLYRLVQPGLVLRCGVAEAAEQEHVVVCRAGQAGVDHTVEKQYVQLTWADANILCVLAELRQ